MLQLIPTRRPDELFFWTAPSTESEFAAEDPLALDYVAQQIGLFLLPTLTTRSARAQSFAVVLYGLHLADRAIREQGLPDDDEVRRELFERWERFWALAVLESRGGVVHRDHRDAMRGVRGAVKAWFGGDKPLPLDYPLISRQQELGSLGAYLSPLRLAGLVTPGTVRPSPAAEEIIRAFWDEPEANSHTSRYEEYAMLALDLERARIERKHGNLTLAKVGERSRLSCLGGKRARPAQQARLYRALLENARDATTLQVTRVVESSSREGIVGPREILDGAIDGRFGTCDGRLIDLMRTARAFGDAMQAVLGAFDRTYSVLAESGWTAKRAVVAARALDDATLAGLQRAGNALLEAPDLGRIRALPMHGAPFVRLVEELRTATPADALARVLAFHHGVQRDRRRGDAWIRDRDGDLTLLLTSYTARPDTPRYPAFKLDVVRTLLIDVGRLPPQATVDEEVDA